MPDPSHHREARLRPEFAGQYPGIQPGVWLNAAALAEHTVAGLIRQGRANLALTARVLDPDHFEFRGGEGPVGGQRAEGRRRQD